MRGTGAPGVWSSPVIGSRKAAGVEPFAYLSDLLTRLPGLPAERAGEFTPRAWAARRPD